MKKILFLAMLAVFAFSCKNEENKTENASESNQKMVAEKETTKTITGEFIYTQGAAVLQGDNFIYGVELNEQAEELAKKVKDFQREEFDMVPVTLKAIVKDNPNEEGWDEVIEIVQVMNISQPNSEPAIKINSENKKQ